MALSPKSWLGDCEMSIGQFTCREMDIIDLISAGYDNKRIAENLKISERTVKNHISHIYRRLGTMNGIDKRVFLAVTIATKGWSGI